MNMTVYYIIKLVLNLCRGKFRVLSQKTVTMNVCSFTCVLSVTNMYFICDLHGNKLNQTMNDTGNLLLNLVVKCCLNPS